MESIVDEGPLAVQRCIDLGLDVSYCFTLRFYAIDSGKRAYYRVGDGSSWIECPSRSPLPADPSRTTAQREHTGACTLFWVRDSTDRLDPQTTGRKDPDDDLGSLRGPLWRWRETSHVWCLDSRWSQQLLYQTFVWNDQEYVQNRCERRAHSFSSSHCHCDDLLFLTHMLPHSI